MSTFREAVENRVVDSLVEGVDRADRLAGLLVNNIPGAPALRQAINGLLGLLGNDPGDSSIDDVAPGTGTGGQCPGVAYDGVIRVKNVVNSTCETFDNDITFTNQIGPITQERVTQPNGTIRVFVRNGAGAQILAQTYNPNPTVNECEFSGSRIDGVDSTRRDGQPDGCGNPGRILPNPSNGIGPIPAPIEFTDRGGNTVNIAGDVSYGPSFTNNGTIVIPFIFASANVNLTGTIGLDGTIELAPEISINPGGEDPVLGEENDGENPMEDGEEGDIIIGVQVLTLDSTGPLTEIGTTIGPDITVPRAASVMFLLDDGEISGWSVDYDIKNTDCIIPAPDFLPCTAVSVTPGPGVTIGWRAIYGRRLIPEPPAAT